MAALNIKETKALHDAMAVIQNVANEGFDPKSDKPEEKAKYRALRKAHAEIKTVWVMKGHYNS